MALAACMDGTVRVIADLMEIDLDRIRVEVVNRADVRDLLRINDVDIPAPTGITMTIDIEASGETEERLAKLRTAAESSAVLNMLRGQTPVEVSWRSPRTAISAIGARGAASDRVLRSGQVCASLVADAPDGA